MAGIDRRTSINKMPLRPPRALCEKMHLWALLRIRTIDNQRRPLDVCALNKCPGGGVEFVQSVLAAVMRPEACNHDVAVNDRHIADMIPGVVVVFPVRRFTRDQIGFVNENFLVVSDVGRPTIMHRVEHITYDSAVLWVAGD